MLLTYGARVDAREGDLQMTPLAVAAFAGHSQVVSVLLANGAAPNAKDKTGSTPLLHAPTRVTWLQSKHYWLVVQTSIFARKEI